MTVVWLRSFPWPHTAYYSIVLLLWNKIWKSYLYPFYQFCYTTSMFWLPNEESLCKWVYWRFTFEFKYIQRSHYTYCINATCVKYLVPIFLFKWHFFEILFYFFEIPTIINVCERGNPGKWRVKIQIFESSTPYFQKFPIVVCPFL